MINEELAYSYLKRARIRFDVLKSFFEKNDFPDIIREAQETTELLQKAILIKFGIRPPKWHEVGNLLIEHIDKIPEEEREKLIALVRQAKWLRSQREIAFYGDMDVIPEELYSNEDAIRAIDTVEGYLKLAEKIFEKNIK